MRYGRADLTRGFSRQHGLNHLWPYGHRHHPSGSGDGFSYRHHFPTGLAPAVSILTGWPTLLRHPIAQTIQRGSGILTGCPSPTPLGLGLGPTNPTRINLPSETLGLRGTCFSHVLRYSCQHSHFCRPQLSFRSTLYLLQNALLPNHKPRRVREVRGFGTMLKPRYIFRAKAFDQ